jgi:hypothetical protein
MVAKLFVGVLLTVAAILALVLILIIVGGIIAGLLAPFIGTVPKASARVGLPRLWQYLESRAR